MCRDPVETRCGHFFCKVCLEEAMKFKQLCPVDREQLKATDYHLSASAKRKILNAAIVCPLRYADRLQVSF